MIYGTPQAEALNPRLEEDKIPGTSPGFGIAAAADGKYYPYLFPIAATYWSQGGRRGQVRQGQAGRQPEGQEDRLHVLRQPGRAGAAADPGGTGEDRRASSCAPSPCRRLASRWARRCSTSPSDTARISSSIAPVRQVAGGDDQGTEAEGLSAQQGASRLVWASAEADIMAAGGWDVAQGYNTMQFAGVGDELPGRSSRSSRCTRRKGKAPPAAMKSSVYYNRGVFQARGMVEAVRNALKLSQRRQARRPRGGQERLRDDQGLHARRPGAAAGDHAGRPRRRRLGAGSSR